MNILFFGRLSDEVGCRQWAYEPSASSVTFAELLAALASNLGDSAKASVEQVDITVAVDQTVVANVDDSLMLTASCEVAFFPPVTGG